MSTSTDGILFYGICLGEEQTAPWDRDDKYGDFEEYILELKGLKRPDTDKEYKKWIQAKKKVMEDFPLGVGTYCSGTYPMYYVYLVGKENVVWRGDAKPITSLFVSSEENIRFIEYCNDYLGLDVELYDEKKHGKDKTMKLGWWLVSYWG